MPKRFKEAQRPNELAAPIVAEATEDQEPGKNPAAHAPAALSVDV